MKKSIDLFIIFLLLFTTCDIVGQSRKELEKQRMQIIKDIEKTSKALENTKKKKEKNLTQLKALEQQVGSRKKLINNLQSEVKLNEKLITQNESRIETLRRKHMELKSQYNNILRKSYLNKISNSKWSYLLSSANLNNLVIRWRYIHQFDQYTTQKLEEIQTISGEIKIKNEEILKTKEDNLNTLQETSKNMVILEKEQKDKDAIVKKTFQGRRKT